MNIVHLDELSDIQSPTRFVFDAIEAEATPFLLGRVGVYVERAFDNITFADWLEIRIPKLKSYAFRHKLDTKYVCGDLEEYARLIGREAAACFRAIRIDPEPNIELGEN